MTRIMASILHAAQSAYPADDAMLEAEQFSANSGEYSADENAGRLDKLRSHWSRVFAREVDATELMCRFIDTFNANCNFQL